MKSTTSKGWNTLYLRSQDGGGGQSSADSLHATFAIPTNVYPAKVVKYEGTVFFSVIRSDYIDQPNTIRNQWQQPVIRKL